MDNPASLSAPRIDEEDVRLVTGFADVFAAAVTALGLIALAAVASPLGQFAGLVVAAAAWGLSGPLVRRRNFAACAILLATALGLGTLTGLWFLYGAAGLPVAFVLWRYWRAFGVPVAAALAIAIPTLTLINLTVQPATFAAYGGGSWRMMVAGVVLFAFAMHFDLGDRLRQTRQSDVAFWLHLMAAPLAVHGLFAVMGWNAFESAREFAAGPIIAVVALLALVALTIDRRPILVSSLIYFAAAIGRLGRNLGAVEGAILVALAVGAFVLVLASFWSDLRRALLAALPAGIAARVPPAGSWAPPAPQAAGATAEDEPVRLVSSFNDVFVVMGVQAVMAGAWLIGGLTAWNRAQVLLQPRWQDGQPVAAAPPADIAASLWTSGWLLVLPPLVLCWLLAEYFVRRRRMALPAVVLAANFALPAWLASALLALRLVPGTLDAAAAAMNRFGPARDFAANWPALLVLACLPAAGLNLLFWWRHRAPVSFAGACAALLPLLFLDLAIAGNGLAWSDAFQWPALRLRLLLGGVLAFAAAMAWDWSDRTRQSQRADVAFWLHLLASALALPALFGIAGEGLGLLPGTVLVYTALLALALVIDRRAPLVIGLVWLAGAMKSLGHSLPMLATAAVLMAIVLNWHALRARIPGLVATTGLGES